MDDAWIRAIVALPFGLVVGSFMTVAVYRLPKGESVVRPRSRCRACGAEIGARDNIPVFSWLLLRGKCRRCGERISVEYPLLELATASVVVLAAIRFPDPWRAVLVAGLLALMPGIALIDLRHRIIPNRLTYPALVLFVPAILLAWAIGDAVDPVRAGLGLLRKGVVLFIVAAIYGGMGMGDVKLAAVIGLVLTWPWERWSRASGGSPSPPGTSAASSESRVLSSLTLPTPSRHRLSLGTPSPRCLTWPVAWCFLSILKEAGVLHEYSVLLVCFVWHMRHTRRRGVWWRVHHRS